MSNYTLRHQADAAIVEMADHVPFPPDTEEREDLQRLIREKETIVVDLSATKSLATLWLRLFAELTEEAETATRRFRLAAVNEALAKTRDYIGLTDHLRTYSTVEEAMQ